MFALGREILSAEVETMSGCRCAGNYTFLQEVRFYNKHTEFDISTCFKLFFVISLFILGL
jgi:hypothetical protein